MSSFGPFVGSDGYGSYSNLGLYGAIDSYGTLNLTQTSPTQNFVEPISVDEICTYLRIASPNDEGLQNELMAFISGARFQAEILQNRDLVIKQWDLTYDYWMSYRVALRAPTRSVDLVQYKDSNGDITTMIQGANADYIIDLSKQPGSISPPYNGVWPTYTPYPSSSLLIRFTSGYPCTDPFWSNDGAMIKTGMKLLISSWFNNRMPFELGSGSAQEYPYALTSCLSHGAILRAR